MPISISLRSGHALADGHSNTDGALAVVQTHEDHQHAGVFLSLQQSRPGWANKVRWPARFKSAWLRRAGITRMGQTEIGASRRHGSIDQADGGDQGRLGRGECCIASTLH